MEGSVTLWLPDWYKLKTKRHPYQRTYREGVKARWEVDPSYCRGELLKPTSEYYYGILEFTDTAVFDFLMGQWPVFCTHYSNSYTAHVHAHTHTHTHTHTQAMLTGITMRHIRMLKITEN